MAHLIVFNTSMFNPETEPRNPNNPIAGKAVLDWLREKLLPHFDLSEPTAEDWGWCSTLRCEDGLRIIGASADLDQVQPVEWALQIHKPRGIWEKLLGRNQHRPDDSVTMAIKRALEGDMNVTITSLDIR